MINKAISILTCSTMLFFVGCNENRKNVDMIVSADTNVTSKKDELKILEMKNSAKKIFPNNLKMNDETIRSTPNRLTFSFSVQNESQLNIESIENRLNHIGAKILLDNGKGAQIYCLNSNETFEIHQPFKLSKIYYDMNENSENKGLFKIIQLDNDWNIRFYLHKKGLKSCEDLFSN